MCTKSQCEETVMDLVKSDEYLSKLISSESMNLKISCRPCSSEGVEGNARGFLKSPPFEIVLCTNRLHPYEIKEILTHEAVHAYDFHNKRCDFDTCKGLAFTEVRAAREGECKSRFYYPFQWMRDDCVQKHATRSTANLFPRRDAVRCVADVFQEAMADKQPVSGAAAAAVAGNK